MKAAFALCALLVVNGCEPEPSQAEGSVCDLAAEFQACPECADGETTCAFENVEFAAVSCQECQARGGLYQRLCDEGSTDTAAAVEDGTTCTTLPAF